MEAFRPSQEEICEAVAVGKDALVVMPTGAGKSLCYQLPGLARGGPTLVISPLIALMEDQVTKLKDLKLKAERIHSGRNRMESRQVCRDYLDGNLDFLFVAPERFKVPGFPEFMARRKPELVAVDEAHCISHWGHDFRPDYRRLSGVLEALRPAPIVAMTATATPLVQKDIVKQLGLQEEERFIRGFRRSNIAIEMAQVNPSRRQEPVRQILQDPKRRPAIVYSSSRRGAEEMAEFLRETLRVEAYHAGMEPARRDRVQQQFQQNEIEVIVATIAFGMGVDKSNIRTVIHCGIPGSIESYYQEIGRVGRDGLPSRAIMLWSWADRRTLEFFLERDYPEISTLKRIFLEMDSNWRDRREVIRKSGIEPEIAEKAIEKLWLFGGVEVDWEDRLRVGHSEWTPPYRRQRHHRQDQVERITSLPSSRTCRMLELVGHFGDLEDSGSPCGHCDQCQPDGCLLKTHRHTTDEEKEIVRFILRELRRRDGRTTGQLFRALPGSAHLNRDEFQTILEASVQVGLLTLDEDSFEKDGRWIKFQRVHLTPSGYQGDEEAILELEVFEDIYQKEPATKKRSRRKSKANRGEVNTGVEPVVSEEEFEVLRTWRLQEARRRKVPAFNILPDQTLYRLLRQKPRDLEHLHAVKGIGPRTVERYGREILKVIDTLPSRNDD